MQWRKYSFIPFPSLQNVQYMHTVMMNSKPSTAFNGKTHISSMHPTCTHKMVSRALQDQNVNWYCWRINAWASLNIKKPARDFWPDRIQQPKSPFIKSNELKLQNPKHSKYERRLIWHLICMKSDQWVGVRSVMLFVHGLSAESVVV